jgi:hypothetical protein
MEVKLLDVRSVDHKYIIAKASVEIPSKKQIIHGVTVFQSGSNRWIKLPQNIVDKNGEKKYYPYIRWTDESEAKSIEASVLAAYDTWKSAQGAASDTNVPEWFE